ncbi:hypothetical protein QEH59_00975 [Coraliomargarita sp. SDUM461004]|uniref:PEP-CTERM sorting domain-containing protein n=1 Tax=Thalassobacterium sedimentorum TaxID=3041258 RepID=A0ABU1AFR8_9BACT|nr:hypothetical protein [Coraliomargarita sp. SDUM461004]MDQ8192978.1 hypothetical protein [Coraliomargarita sp. SDUM461004]
MKIPNQSKHGLMIFTAVCLASASIQAETLISYSASNGYVATDANFARPTAQVASNPYVYRTSFSDTNQMSPVSGYTGPTFYGGHEFWSDSVDGGFSRRQIRNNTGSDNTDQIYLQSYSSGGFLNEELRLAGVYIFKQEDFSNDLNTGAVTLTSLTVSTAGFINSTDESLDFDGRYVVQVAGGNYYVSQTALNLRQNNGSFSLSGTALSNEQWALYTPSTSLNFDQNAASYTSISLSEITAVGLYFEEDEWIGTDSSSTAYGLGIRSFEASGTSSIPEPAHAGAMILAIVCSVGAFLRRPNH